MEDTREKLAVESKNLEKLKDALAKSSRQTKEMSGILSHFDERLSKLEETIQPVYRETGNLQKQQENIVKTLEYLDYVIRFYTVAGEVESQVKTGPLPGRLESYLECLERLQEAIGYFTDKNPESPELLNINDLFEIGSRNVENELRLLLNRLSNPVSPSTILDLVHDDEPGSSHSSEKTELESFPDKNKDDLRIMCHWLCRHAIKQFTKTYASIRRDVLLSSISGLRDHMRSGSGVIPHGSGPNVSPTPPRKSLTAALTPTSKKAPKGIQTAFKKLQDVIPGGVTRSQTNPDLREDPAMTDREIVAYLTSVTALYKLMQHELKLMEGIIPFEYQKEIFSEIVLEPLTSIVKEGEELAARVRRCVSRYEFTPVLSLFPILRHQASMRHGFDLILDGCSQDVLKKFQGLIITLQTTISKALNEFIDFIKNDADTKVPKDGTVHELTSNVMLFVVNLDNFVDILSRVITGPQRDLIQRAKDGKDKLVYAQYITRVLSALGLTLKNKSEVYSDSALRAIFLLNNFHYILKTLRKSGLISVVNLFDRDVEIFLEEQVLENKKEYSKSWSRILQVILEMDSRSLPTSPSGTNISFDSQASGGAKMKDKERQAIKDKFHMFNKEFEDIRRTQTTYAIPDHELRESLKKDNRDFILPRYHSFFSKYANTNFAKNMDKYVKYAPDEVDRIMWSFFDSAA